MHHKRGRAKRRRAGCLLCKPHKMNGVNEPRRQERRANEAAEQQLASLRERYARMAQAQWFRDAYENRSVG